MWRDDVRLPKTCAKAAQDTCQNLQLKFTVSSVSVLKGGGP